MRIQIEHRANKRFILNCMKIRADIQESQICENLTYVIVETANLQIKRKDTAIHGNFQGAKLSTGVKGSSRIQF